MRAIFGILLIFSLTTTVIAHPTLSKQNARPVIIAGKVISPKGESSITLAVNRVGFHQEELTSPLDATGHFKFRFYAYIPTDAWLSYQTNFLVLTHPGDSVYIELDGTTNDRATLLKTIVFKGDAAAANQSAALFQQQYYAGPLYDYDYDKHQDKIKNLEPAAFIRYCDSIRKESIKFHEAFIKREKPNAEVATWSRLFIDDTYYYNLNFYPDDHRKALVLKRSEWKVADNYYDFLLNYHDIKPSLISGHAISGYIERYTIRYIGSKVQHDIVALNKTFTNEQEDSITIQSIIKYTKDPLTRAMSLCYYLNDLLDQGATGTFEKSKAITNANITYPFLLEPLYTKYSDIKKALESDNHTPIQLSNTGISFVDSVIQVNKGKVIYIDIWATWCGPCREEFPYAQKLEDTFPNNVVFLYLCLDSNENAYQNLVKKYAHHGIHRLLDDKQSSALKLKYKVDGFPHYMLIDKKGEIAFAGYTIKPSEDGTSSLINELIRK